MTSARSCLLIGYGYVARATARRLREAGWQVSATVRSQTSEAAVRADDVAVVRADLATMEGAAALRAAVSAHDAAISSVPPGMSGDPVLKALEDMDTGQTWLGYLSTTGVYGDRQGGWSFEWDALNPGPARSRARAEADLAWQARGARVFRLGGIYGPGRSAIDRIREGGAIAWIKPGQVFGRIHVDDIASALVLAMDRPSAHGVFNLVDDWPSDQAEVLWGAADMLGAAPPQERTFDPGEASPMLASFFSECRRVSNARAKAALGWRPAYPHWRDGLKAILVSENIN
ncbi:SDR family NAD(P)-dependent oxidoreductase [Alkalicaulis satelles]|uniref:SDR family NAD(P)-dependent oxidoreductase n=1 Tax=Alkalicaulis satelles TaxID=2609175 RepID=A0A5M6ZGG6_9PROT|nr:NAD-dependent epimerase/dehydratase family protein [Alkalicaulis satelles]KAA5803833.1 SDR family NAD(P)-dependent oxidoreductase [Alkalicaulis satelles]